MNSSFYMYTMNMPPMKKARVEAQLSKRIRMSDNRIISAADYIAAEMRDGYVPVIVQVYTAKGNLKDECRLQKTTSMGTSSVQPFNKTMYDFAQYLVEKDAVSEDGQNALRNQENEVIAERQRQKQAEQERELADMQQLREARGTFKEWRKLEAEKYVNDPRVAAVHDIMTKMYEGYPLHRCAELVMLCSNLHDERVRLSLEESLHPMNKGSRKAFTYVTGIKLPAGVKATRELLRSLPCEKGCDDNV